LTLDLNNLLYINLLYCQNRKSKNTLLHKLNNCLLYLYKSNNLRYSPHKCCSLKKNPKKFQLDKLSNKKNRLNSKKCCKIDNWLWFLICKSNKLCYKVGIFQYFRLRKIRHHNHLNPHKCCSSKMNRKYKQYNYLYQHFNKRHN
jgi:hypothetical protein